MTASTTVLIVVAVVAALMFVALLRSRARYKRYRRGHVHDDRICASGRSASVVTARPPHPGRDPRSPTAPAVTVAIGSRRNRRTPR